MKYQAAIPFGVIGLGRFGTALANALAESGHEVLCLDRDEKKIKRIQEVVAQAFVCEELDKDTLREAGIQNCDTVIVCVGEEVQASIITTLNAIELGVSRVISKAVSAEHGRVLKKIGAEVIYPERERALRLAQVLTNSRAIDHIELSPKYAIVEFNLEEAFSGKCVQEMQFRTNYGLNIIAIITQDETIVEIDPAYIFKQYDAIVAVGTKENIARFEKDL